METEYPALSARDKGDSRHGDTESRRNSRWMAAPPPLSSHTAAPPLQTTIHTTSPPVQTEIGPSDLPASVASESPPVGQVPVLPCYGVDSFMEGDSSLGDIEILRMASPPPSKQRRHQSPSPDGRRLLTPTKKDSTTPKKMRTPRKDTPKKRSRLQCRVKGCRDYLSSVRARDRHETEYCRFREGAGSGLSSNTFPVLSHSELQIAPLQCRACLKAFGNEKARKRHEKDTHRIFEMKGKSFSPVIFSSPVQSELPIRPQS